MPVGLSDLLPIATKDEVLTTLVGFLKLTSFPVTAWQSGSLGRELVEKFSQLGADWSAVVSRLAKGGFLELAEGDWLTVYAKSVYNITRNSATSAVGTVVLADGGSGPYTIATGDLVATSNSGKRYRNTTGGTLNASGTLSLTFQAESPGASYNVGVGTIATLATPLAGVTLTNSEISGTGTWLTTSGTDEESDTALRERCRAQWGALGSGGNADAYRYWARKASSAVTRVAVAENTPSAGQVTVYVAGSSGPISATELTAVQTYVETRRPLCVTATVTNASELSVTVTAAISYRSTVSEATVQANVMAALEDLEAAKDLGGGYVYRSEIIAAIQNVDGVVAVTLTTPAADVALAAAQLPAFTTTDAVGATTLSWTAI